MKKNILLLLFLIPVSSFSSGINFFQGSFEQAKEKAKKENKLIFVDFYAIWCGPCKWMSSNVFPDSLVGSYFNKHFVSVKIDAEKQEKELVQNVKIEAYPTLAFFKPDGNLFYKLKGGMDVPNFMKLGKQVAEFEKNRLAYEKNRKDVKSMTSYLLVLEQSEPEKAKKIAMDYLSTIKPEQSDNPENWTLILTFDRNYNSRFFQYAVGNFKHFMDSVPGFQEYFTGVTGKLLEDAIQNKDTALRDEYKKYAEIAMKGMGQEFPSSFPLEVDIYYYAQTGNQEEHLKTLDTYLMYYTGTVQKIADNTYEILERYGIKVVQPYVEKWAQKAMVLEKTSYTWMLYAYIQREAGNNAEALKYAKEALAMARPEDDTAYIRDFISELEE